MPPKPGAVDLENHGVVVIGQLGWLYWHLNPALDLRAGIAVTGDGLHVQALVTSSTSEDEPLTRAALRDIPLGVLQRALTGGPLPDAIRTAWDQKSAPDLRPEVCDTASAEAILKSAAHLDTGDNMLVVETTPGRRRDDSFYTQVELIYALAVARGSSGAAQEIAEANDVPLSTVYRWLKEGRRRSAAKAAEARKARKTKQPGLWPAAPDPQAPLFDEDQPPAPN